MKLMVDGEEEEDDDDDDDDDLEYQRSILQETIISHLCKRKIIAW